MTVLNDGGYIVSWASYTQDGDNYGVYIQRYNEDGTTYGTETAVNTETNHSQNLPSIAALADGGYIVTWTSLFQDGDRDGVYSQRYNEDGTTYGDETQVNTTTDSSQFSSSVIALDDGGYIISWSSKNQDGDSYGIYTQRYNEDGTLNGVETLVNTTTDESQNYSSITTLADGGYIVTWSSRFQDGDMEGVYIQRYNENGTPYGIETQVNTTTD